MLSISYDTDTLTVTFSIFNCYCFNRIWYQGHNTCDHIDGITIDPEDDMFIACALNGDADYIVSQDLHLQNIKHFQRIQIIDATTFVNKIVIK
ncbi:MAG: PIN domain-containing protein [Desulfobacula sp.]|nr:PIN domain-containing protein [Desulfobacula sp.]